jgi:hypothetical protein
MGVLSAVRISKQAGVRVRILTLNAGLSGLVVAGLASPAGVLCCGNAALGFGAGAVVLAAVCALCCWNKRERLAMRAAKGASSHGPILLRRKRNGS